MGYCWSISSKLCLFISVYTACPVMAGTWERLSPDTIRFTGEIQDGEYQRFKAVFDVDVTTVLVDARGGPILEGLRIGYALLKRNNITVIVNGICTSATANYIFLAATNRIIQDGIVGFHGNATSFYNSQNPQIQDVPGMANELGDDALLVNPEDVAWGNLRKAEELFFQHLGISQELFNITEREAKSLGIYYYLLPSAETFMLYGIKVQGTQSFRVAMKDSRIRALPLPVLIR